MKFLNPMIHGVVDYLAVLMLLFSPSIFGFGGTPATVCYVAAASFLVLSILTRYPLGIIKRIPFPIHGTVELVLSILFVALPWIAQFNELDDARNFFVVSGIALFVVWLVTNYRAVPEDSSVGLPVHHRATVTRVR